MDCVGKVRRLAVADPTLPVALPKLPGGLIEVMHIGTCVDDIVKRPTDLAKRLNLICQCRGNAFDFNRSA